MREINTQNKRFSDGNGRDQLGTVVTADWLNAVQDELVGLLRIFGGRPNPQTPNQIAQLAHAALAGKLGNNGDQSISGGLSISRPLVVDNPASWHALEAVSGDGKWVLETSPQGSADRRFQFKFLKDGDSALYVRFPAINSNQAVAYQSWVSTQLSEQGHALNRAVDGKVGKTGNETVAGEKTFSAVARFSDGLRISAGNKSGWATLGMGAGDVYLNNPASNKFLQLKDDGTLAYSNVKVLLATDRSHAVNLDDPDKIATSRAVKAAYDRAVTASAQAESAAPSGEVAFFAGASAPAGWLKANGAAVSRTAYARLFAAIGTAYGAGDGRSTFNLPDLRGEFVRGFDDGRGIDGGRVSGSAQADEIRAHSHLMFDATGAGYSNTHIDLTAETYARAMAWRGSDEKYNIKKSDTPPNAAKTSTAGGNETRPRNIALLACIKI